MLLNRLPEHHFRSGLVQQLLGKAYLEVNNYNASLIAFREMMRLEPFRLTGIELMSSALWQLKKDKELCSLAQKVVEIDRYSPQTWCVVGNCFSLQRDPDMALRFFKRAIQIEPNFVYAHTLCGHEYVHNEDFDKAILCYRRSLMLSDRHYYAWYGLGSIYMRQEKFDMAEAHFRRALEINAASSVLSCFLAMVLHATAQQSSDSSPARSLEALKILQDAIKIDGKNPQLHYELAHISFSLGQYQKSLVAIEAARSLAPREPPIFVLMARIHHKLNNHTDSMKCFQMAIDLDPKEIGFIKDDLEALDSPDLGEVLNLALTM
jgi:anaphase-promoting complex subunit 3